MTTPMSAEERGKSVEREMRLLWSENRVDEITGFFTEQIRQAEAAAEQRGYRRGLEDADGQCTIQALIDSPERAVAVVDVRSWNAAVAKCLGAIRALAKDSEVA